MARSSDYRRDGSLRPSRAKGRLQLLVRLADRVDINDLSRLDTDNVQVAILILGNVVDRQRRRAEQLAEVDETAQA